MPCRRNRRHPIQSLRKMSSSTILLKLHVILLIWIDPLRIPSRKRLTHYFHYLKDHPVLINITWGSTSLCESVCSWFTSPSLEPFTKYRFWLKAFTWKNEGRSSRPAIEATTDVRGPSAPIIANLTCKDEHAIFIEWDRPRQISHTIDFYFIGYKPEHHQSDDPVDLGQTTTSDLAMEAQDPWRGYHVITLDSRDFGFKEGKVGSTITICSRESCQLFQLLGSQSE